jgi:serine/threonine protein kinase
MNHFHSLNNNANTKNVVKEARNLGSLNGAASQDRLYFKLFVIVCKFASVLFYRKDIAMKYHVGRKFGQGTFGSVAFARVVETGEMVAIKTVLLDKSIINRELQVMRQLANKPHPYIVILKDDYLNKNSNDDVQLSLVLELFPETIYSIAQYYNSRNEQFPIFAIKLYMYQLARAVAHIHGMGISHRFFKFF